MPISRRIPHRRPHAASQLRRRARHRNSGRALGRSGGKPSAHLTKNPASTSACSFPAPQASETPQFRQSARKKCRKAEYPSHEESRIDVRMQLPSSAGERDTAIPAERSEKVEEKPSAHLTKNPASTSACSFPAPQASETLQSRQSATLLFCRLRCRCSKRSRRHDPCVDPEEHSLRQ